MTASSGSKRATVGLLLGLSYGSILAVLSLGAAGAGHGTLIPLLLSSAPLSVFYWVAKADAGLEVAFFAMLYGGPIIWAALGLLIALPGRGKGLRLTQVLVLLHYAFGIAVVAMTGDRPTGLAGELPVFFIIWAPVYLAGQAALWWQISKRDQLRPIV
jgi:hypothetical protein